MAPKKRNNRKKKPTSYRGPYLDPRKISKNLLPTVPKPLVESAETLCSYEYLAGEIYRNIEDRHFSYPKVNVELRYIEGRPYISTLSDHRKMLGGFRVVYVPIRQPDHTYLATLAEVKTPRFHAYYQDGQWWRKCNLGDKALSDNQVAERLSRILECIHADPLEGVPGRIRRTLPATKGTLLKRYRLFRHQPEDRWAYTGYLCQPIFTEEASKVQSHPYCFRWKKMVSSWEYYPYYQHYPNDRAQALLIYGEIGRQELHAALAEMFPRAIGYRIVLPTTGLRVEVIRPTDFWMFDMDWDDDSWDEFPWLSELEELCETFPNIKGHGTIRRKFDRSEVLSQYIFPFNPILPFDPEDQIEQLHWSDLASLSLEECSRDSQSPFQSDHLFSSSEECNPDDDYL